MKVLYVEDDPSHADLARRKLGRRAPHISLDVAMTLSDARARLGQRGAYDLVLAGGIAHDFNNLLQVILGNLELIDARLAPGVSAHVDVEEAVHAANRAADLTRQMLAYAGKGQFVVEEVNLNDLLAENASMFRTAISRTVDLQIHRQPELPPILADASQMQQVLMNLLANASEAIGERPGNVTVRTGVMACDAGYLRGSCLEDKPASGQFVWLEVTDDGCGMDEETQKRLFEPFYTTKFTGRGLGMSAVMGIVRGLRGALMVDSHQGKGTTVRVLFPVMLAARAEARELQVASSRPLASDVTRWRKHCAVVRVQDLRGR